MNNFLKRLGAGLCTMALLNPALAAGRMPATTANFGEAVTVFNAARPAFEKKGLNAFIEAIPVSLSDEDHRFATAHVSGVGSLPQVSQLDDGSVRIWIDRGTTHKELNLRLSDARTLEVEIAGQRFQASKFFSDNFKAIDAIVNKKPLAQRVLDTLVPSAQASGMDSGTLITAALVAVGAGLLTYFVVKNNTKSSSSSSSSKSTSGPEVGNTVAVSLH